MSSRIGLLMWDKPKQVMSPQEYAEEYSSSAEATGTYVGNMSEEDKARWRAKKIGGAWPRVEIRKSIQGTQIVLIVALEGDKHEDYNIRLSMNGPILAYWEEWAEMQEAIAEARDELVP